MSEGWESFRSTVRLESDGSNQRLHVDYAIVGLEETRKTILLRRALAVLAAEETRLYALTDDQAIAELDALKAQQDVQKITQYPVGSE